MIIGVDAGVLGVTDDRLKAGVYNLVSNLLKYLTKLDSGNIYRLYSFSPIPRSVLAKFGPNVQNIIVKPKIGWLTLWLSLELLINKVDVFLGFGQALPIYHPAKSIVYMYDLAFELYPQFYAESYKKLSRQSKFAAKHADAIVAISNSTKNDLVRLYGVDKDKIGVIYPGVSLESSTSEESRSLPRHHPRCLNDFAIPEVSKPYFLFVGSYKPVKNIPNIIKAFSLFKDFSYHSKNKHLSQYRLILAGSEYWIDKEILKQVQDDNVKILGYVPDEDLLKLYRGATALVSPSFYEGFGIPLLEAMAAGTPVITSNCGSIPEVVGFAALKVNPEDINGLKDAMISIVKDKNLRTNLIDRGLKQASKFSWEKSVSQLLKVINNKGMDLGSSPG